MWVPFVVGNIDFVKNHIISQNIYLPLLLILLYLFKVSPCSTIIISFIINLVNWKLLILNDKFSSLIYKFVN